MFYQTSRNSTVPARWPSKWAKRTSSFAAKCTPTHPSTRARSSSAGSQRPARNRKRHLVESSAFTGENWSMGWEKLEKYTVQLVFPFCHFENWLVRSHSLTSFLWTGHLRLLIGAFQVMKSPKFELMLV